MFYLALPHVQFTFDMSSSASQTISPLVTHVRSSDKREIGSFTILNQSVPNNSRQKIIIIPLTLLLRGIIPRVPWDERRGAGKRRAAFLDGIYGLGSIPAWALGGGEGRSKRIKGSSVTRGGHLISGTPLTKKGHQGSVIGA